MQVYLLHEGQDSCDAVMVSPLGEDEGLARLLHEATKMSWSPRNSFNQLRKKETESILHKRATGASGTCQRRHSVVLRPRQGSRPAHAEAHPQPKVVVEGDGRRMAPRALSWGRSIPRQPRLVGESGDRGPRKPMSFCGLTASAAALWKVTGMVTFF